MNPSFDQPLINELKGYQQFILNDYIPNENKPGQIPFFYIPMNAAPCPREKQITENGFEDYSFSSRDAIFSKHKTEISLIPGYSMNTALIATGPLYARIIILADPGFGKTQILKWILNKWAQTDLQENTTPVPFLINISEYYNWQPKGSKSIKRYLEEIVSQFSNKLSTMLDIIFHSGCFSLLLDGLDEVDSPSEQKEIVQNINSFLDTYSPIKTIITSRFYNVAHNYWLGSNFKVFILEKESLNVHSFMKKWKSFSSGNDSKSNHSFYKEYYDPFKVKDICNLLDTPLFTYLYASNMKSNHNARHSFSIVKKCIECLIDWKQPSTILSNTKKLTLLKEISYLVKMGQSGCNGNQIPSATLKETIIKTVSAHGNNTDLDTVDNIADQLCYQGILHYSSNKDMYRFSYNAFQEYLFSLEILDQVQSKILSFEELTSQIFIKYCPQKYWQETLSYIATNLPTDQASPLFTTLLNHEYYGKSATTRIFFLAKALINAGIPELMDKFREILVHELKQIIFMPFDSGSDFFHEDKK